jgi:hypothetical protein
VSDQFAPHAGPSPANPEVGRYVVFISAAVLAVASLLTVYEIDLGLDDEDAALGATLLGGLDTSWRAWSDAWSIFPLVPIVLVAAILGAIWLVAEQADGMNVRDHILGLRAASVRVIIGVLAVLTLAAFVLRSFMTSGEESLDLGVGAWLLLAGAVGYLVGAVLDDRTSAEPAEPVTAPELREPSSLVILGSGLLVLVASFLPAVGASGAFAEDGNEAETLNAWGEGFRPVFGLPAIAAVVVVVLLLLHQRGSAQAPLGMSSPVWRWAFSVFALVAALSLLIGNPIFGAFGNFIDVEFGQYLSALGAIGLVVGSFLERSASDLAHPGSSPPTSF